MFNLNRCQASKSSLNFHMQFEIQTQKWLLFRKCFSGHCSLPIFLLRLVSCWPRSGFEERVVQLHQRSETVEEVSSLSRHVVIIPIPFSCPSCLDFGGSFPCKCPRRGVTLTQHNVRLKLRSKQTLNNCDFLLGPNVRASNFYLLWRASKISSNSLQNV